MNTSTSWKPNPLGARSPLQARGSALPRFAHAHRLKLRRDPGDATEIIAGKLGQIYEHSETHFGVMLMLGSVRAWSYARKRLIAAGSEIIQNGDCEGSARFSKADRLAAKQAVREAKIRAKRRPSATQLRILKANGFGKTAEVGK